MEHTDDMLLFLRLAAPAGIHLNKAFHSKGEGTADQCDVRSADITDSSIVLTGLIGSGFANS